MHTHSLRWFVSSLTVLALLLAVMAGGAAVMGHTTQAPAAPQATASLHNPTFDNHDWYEFNDRYGHYLTGSWLPDDDNNASDSIPLASRQDWRLWFMDGWGIPEYDPDSTHADSVEAVVMRSYNSTDNILGGIYQPIYGTTPCLVYEFTMKAQSRLAADDELIAIQVGIDRVGWHPTTDDPAVHGSFPSSTVWGTAKKPLWAYQTLSVQAEALADSITVFTYAHANGGNSHQIYFDTGTFRDVTPSRIYDPDNYAATSGISGLAASVGGTSATISWTSIGEGISQVFYHPLPSTVSSTTTYSYTIYLPLISSTMMWQATALDKNATTSHSVTISGLEPGTTYEYFVVTRGLSDGACTDWVSNKQQFTTAP
jgi:hypothetical protein